MKESDKNLTMSTSTELNINTVNHVEIVYFITSYGSGLFHHESMSGEKNFHTSFERYFHDTTQLN